MNLRSTGLVLLSLFIYVHGTPPEITNFGKVAILPERTNANLELSTISCSDVDGDPTKVYVRSVSPPNKAFEVLDCQSDECLQYRAGVSPLNYASAQSYLVTIACDDNIGPPVTEVIQVFIQPNSPPYFANDLKFQLISLDGKAAAGTSIYKVDGVDDDGDSITYSMTVEPGTSSGNYRIDPVTGEIFTTVDMRTECRNDVTFLVSMNDGTSTTGPLVISAPITNPNVAPVGLNLDTPIMIPEDTSPGTAATMKFTDGNGDKVTYSYTASNAAGAAQFSIDGKSLNIDISKALDYENSALRQTDLIVTATDGFCSSPPYSLKLRVTDVNEKPTITPSDTSVEVCEGKGEFDCGHKVTDPDIPDTIKWSLSPLTSNTQGRFSINPDTGAIIKLIDYDVDPDKPTRTSKMSATQKFIVVATDKGSLTATATCTATFLDCNDNPPMFVKPAYEAATTECTTGGARVGTVSATDKDSARNQNNVIRYEGSGGAVQVGTGGEIIVNYPLPAGSVVTFNVYAYDLGKDPGPLRSPNPTVVSVRFTPCPTTPPPTAAPPTTTTTTTTTPKPAATTAARSLTTIEGDPNLPWIIIAALLGAFMLGLLAYMLWRYGRLCADACKNLNCGKSCRGRPARPTKVVER